MKKLDLLNQKFGRLTVIKEAGKDKNGRVRWKCLCDCGKITIVRRSSLQSGDTKSCGCLRAEKTRKRLIKHEMCATPTYKSWECLKQRCNNKKDSAYKDYGGRGIKVCKQWLDFENFLADMGEKPERLTIERRDNGKGYAPDNCYWATYKEQNRNRRDNRLIRYQGKTQCLSAWGEELQISDNILWKRLKKYPPQIAFNM